MGLDIRAATLSLLLAAVPCGAQTAAPSPELPATPAATSAQKLDLSLHGPLPDAVPGTLPGLHVVMSAHGDVPPLNADQPELCYAPAEGIYDLSHAQLSAAQRDILSRYRSVVGSRIDLLWTSKMPRAASDPWVRKASVTLRFAVMPSGEIDPPLVTISSGRHDFDKHAIAAVTQASPFDPLPPGIAQPVAFCLTFNYLKSLPDVKTPYWDYQVPSVNHAAPRPAVK